MDRHIFRSSLNYQNLSPYPLNKLNDYSTVHALRLTTASLALKRSISYHKYIINLQFYSQEPLAHRKFIPRIHLIHHKSSKMLQPRRLLCRLCKNTNFYFPPNKERDIFWLDCTDTSTSVTGKKPLELNYSTNYSKTRIVFKVSWLKNVFAIIGGQMNRSEALWFFIRDKQLNRQPTHY